MMINKLLIAAALASSTLVAVPTSAAANTPEDCFLRAACVFMNGTWVCPDPRIFALCDSGGWGVTEG